MITPPCELRRWRTNNMIDRPKRDNLAHRLRLLAAGQITNDKFEDSLDLRSEDAAIWRIYKDGAWSLYSDLKEYKLVGRDKLPKEVKRDVARVVLFLKSDREFEWREPAWYIKTLMAVLGILTIGFIPRWFYRHAWAKQGDINVWPYLRPEDFAADLEKQPYLSGKS